MSPILEIMENVTSTRILFESALQAYVGACSALGTSCMAGGFPPAKLETLTSDELACFASYEGKLQTAKRILGNVRNHTKPICALPPEILSRIFHLVPFEPLSEGPVHRFRFPKRLEYISGTCSRWRQVALDTPSLWTYICFAPQRFANRGLIPRAKVYITRAGVLPLQINLTEYSFVYKVGGLSEPCYTEDDLLLEFLASIAPRISSAKLVGSMWNSGPYGKLIETCLAGAIPGILTRLDITRRNSPGTTVIGSAEDSDPAPTLALDIPAQRFEDLLSSITKLSLKDTQLPWTSKAFHGLVELRLSFRSNLVPSIPEIKMPESQLYRILASSPNLRIFVFDMDIQPSHSNRGPANSFALGDLNELDLRGLDHSYLGSILPLVAPGPGLSLVRLNLANADPGDSHLNEAFKTLFNRVDAPKVCLDNVNSLQWLEVLHGSAPNVSILAMHSLNIHDTSNVQTSQSESTPARQDLTGYLHISNSSLSLTHLNWILDTCHIRTLTLRESRVYLSPGDNVGDVELTAMMSQKCLSVIILGYDEPDPVWG